MKIARLETFTDQYVCFVRVTADSGAVGWGQMSTYNADITALIFHRQVAPWALGANALDIDALITRLDERERCTRNRRDSDEDRDRRVFHTNTP